MARKLLLIRHPCADGAPRGAFVGRTDLPLSNEGLQQVHKLLPLVQAVGPEACYCSPLARARQTADVIINRIRLPVRIDDDLREIDFGRWECKTFEQVAAEDSHAVKRWASFDHRFSFPEGESIGGFLARVRRAAKHINDDPASTVLAITHGGIIRALICHFLAMRPRQYVLFDISPASCTIIDLFKGRGVLRGLNIISAEDYK